MQECHRKPLTGQVLPSLAVVLLLFSLLPTCLDDRCGDEHVLQDGVCVPKDKGDAGADAEELPTDSGSNEGGAAAEAGQDGAVDTGLDGAADASDPLADLGKTCAENNECSGKADFCAKMPTAPTGYCTMQNCSLDPDDCPEGYYCVDMSAMAPGSPNLCFKKK